VNEIQLIRSQLNAERQRAAAVARACAAALAGADPQAIAGSAALEAFRHACVDYLACVLAWFDGRDQRLRELYARRPAADPDREALEQVLAGGGGSREALERLESAALRATGAPGHESRSRAQQRWQEFARFFAGPWDTRREAIDRMLSANPRVADWRVIGGIDADSILEERRRYERVQQHLPPGAIAAFP
jgi:hypothetical protein